MHAAYWRESEGACSRLTRDRAARLPVLVFGKAHELFGQGDRKRATGKSKRIGEERELEISFFFFSGTLN